MAFSSQLKTPGRSERAVQTSRVKDAVARTNKSTQQKSVKGNVLNLILFFLSARRWFWW
jgi:hypothetical protein